MRAICRSEDLSDGGKGVRFTIEAPGSGKQSAFAIRYRGKVYAYLNRCAHMSLELDWLPGEFFDHDGRYLICATHGATYHPDSGLCAGGPCRGQKLGSLALVESYGKVYLSD